MPSADRPEPPNSDNAAPAASTQNIFSEVYHNIADAVTQHPTAAIVSALAAAGGTIAAVYLTRGRALAGIAEDAIGASARGALDRPGEAVLGKELPISWGKAGSAFSGDAITAPGEAHLPVAAGRTELHPVGPGADQRLSQASPEFDTAMYTHEMHPGHVIFGDKDAALETAFMPGRPSEFKHNWRAPDLLPSGFEPAAKTGSLSDLDNYLSKVPKAAMPDSMPVGSFQGRLLADGLADKSAGKYTLPPLEGGLTGLNHYPGVKTAPSKIFKAMLDRQVPKSVVDSGDSLYATENAQPELLGRELPDPMYSRESNSLYDLRKAEDYLKSLPGNSHWSWGRFQPDIDIGKLFKPPVDLKVSPFSAWADLFKPR